MSRASEIAAKLGLGAGAGRARGRALIVGGAALGLAALVALLGLNGDDSAYRYVTEAARRGELVATVTATGTLEPTNQVDVGSELSGTIREVLVDFNDEVEIGQVLARLDTTRLDAQVLQSEAAVEAARARVEQARATDVEAQAQLARLERAHEMSGGKVPSRQELDAGRAIRARARADLASAKAAVAQAKATLDAQRTDLAKTVIRSPIRGVVLLRAVEPGQTVAASLQAPILFTLAEDLTRMELAVAVDEADVGRVQDGQQASFRVDAWPERLFHARVAQVRFGATEPVEGAAATGVVTYETVLEVDNAERLLRPGMTATADIVVQRIADALLVPNGALRFSPPRPAQEESGEILRALTGGRRFGRANRRPEANGAERERRVYVLRKGVPEPVTVEVGASDGAWTEIRGDAIAPGTELVVDALARPS
jgi:HlyD family secretion protein